MTQPKPRICILFCGGTIVQKQLPNGTFGDAPKEEAIAILLNLEPRLHERYELTVEYIDNIDSAAITSDHWDIMAQAVERLYHQYDGFVITHGTHTMAYTAGALSFCLQNLGKPVVLTGAQIPGFKIDTDARRNLINAVQVAGSDMSGVVLVFDEEVLHGTRVSKISESKLDAYEPINGPLAGEIRTEIRLDPSSRKRESSDIKLQTGFCDDVAVLTLTPGTNPGVIEALVKRDTRGIILRGFGPGALDYRYLEVLKAAQRLKIPVLMNSQCLLGVTHMRVYDNSYQALEAGVIECFDMSLEAATTKLMWALEHFHYEKIKTIMHHNFVGEINIPTHD